MQIRKIVEGRDYGFSRYSEKNRALGERNLHRVRILEKGVARDVRDHPWGDRREGARKDGVRIRRYDREGNLTEREDTIPSRWIRAEWHEFDTEQRLLNRRREHEREQAQRERERQEARKAALNERIVELGLEDAIQPLYGSRWTLRVDGLEKVLDRIQGEGE